MELLSTVCEEPKKPHCAYNIPLGPHCAGVFVHWNMAGKGVSYHVYITLGCNSEYRTNHLEIILKIHPKQHWPFDLCVSDGRIWGRGFGLGDIVVIFQPVSLNGGVDARAMRTMSSRAVRATQHGVRGSRPIQPVQQSNPHPRYSFLSFHTRTKKQTLARSQASVSCIVFTTLISRDVLREVRRAAGRFLKHTCIMFDIYYLSS
jgi:hypothetical protein